MTFTAYILDVMTDSVYPARITIDNGIFSEIVPIVPDEDFKVDVEGLLLPGFIDSHIHIESSMLTPAQFAKVAVRHGTTSVVCDPHEIANVCGIEGIEFMIENASHVPFNFYFSAPSCVPATAFETSGATIDSDDIEFLLQKEEMVALGEMMNFPGVINGDEEVLRKLKLAKKYDKPIDGHAPLLSGKELDKYLEQYIVTDHECSNFSEAIEKKQKGMKIMVRDGSSAKNMEVLFDFNERLNYWKNQESFGIIPTEVLERRINSPIFDFIVSDDKNPRDLVNGHLNKSIKKAWNLGVDIIKAIEMVTINPAAHYNLDAGAIVTGAKADFVIVDNLLDFNILKTYISGECVFDGENVLFDAPEVETENTIKASLKKPEDFDVLYDGDECEVNVIKCYNGDLLTKKTTAKLLCKNGKVQPDIYEDILKIAVVERYGGNNIANAFIKGFSLKNGAMASSISHDSHNIIVVGYDSKMMADAVNMVIENNGGISVVSEDFRDSLALPIAGLMSNKDAFEVAKKLRILQKMADALGCELDAPFMTMAFMALLVIPSLRISAKGLFDCDSFEFIDVIMD
ncbi:adenine deaminase [Methanobrevibacter millerae]|uniref:Adenine deaminase n=1 Tax=Methanobrevibacter millerae TaxID=230361 RepID=A0A1G5UU56_9EURY|nr:adenine deaminase [Methanobrevibacter millerae]SDA37140.1 Adenine deaminase [Methanobrevibacter millerae]